MTEGVLEYDRLHYAPFSQDCFDFISFMTGPYPMFRSGSDIPPPLLMVDGDTGYWVYGVFRMEANGCPHCHSAIGGTLMIAPFDADHRYYRCPICGTVSRWEVTTEMTSARLADDWEVSVPFTAGIQDNDEDFPNYW